MVERAVRWRVFLQAIALLAVLAFAFTWWRWSNSIDLKLTADFPFTYCVDVVSGERLTISPDGELRLKVARRDQTAIIDVVTPQGAYRAKIPCGDGYFWYLRPLPESAETIWGPGTWSVRGLDLFLEAAVPGACAVVSSQPVTASRVAVSSHRSGIHWVSCDRGKAGVLDCTLTLQGSQGWTLQVDQNGLEESRVWAVAERIESLFLIDTEGHVQHAVREGDLNRVIAPSRGVWSVHARSVDGEDMSVWIDCADNGAGTFCDYRLTPP